MLSIDVYCLPLLHLKINSFFGFLVEDKYFMRLKRVINGCTADIDLVVGVDY